VTITVEDATRKVFDFSFRPKLRLLK
jgi:hypothetical protein